MARVHPPALLVVVAAVLLLAAPVLAATAPYTVSANLTLLAVERNGTGITVPATVTISAPGVGLVRVEPRGFVAPDTYWSTRLAYLYAAIASGRDPRLYNTEVSFITVGGVSGPSASGYLAAVMELLLSGSGPSSRVSMTGMLGPTGMLLPVAGVPAKLRAAMERGERVVVVPLTVYANLTGRARLHAVPACMVEEAVPLIAGGYSTINASTVPRMVRVNLTQVYSFFAHDAARFQALARRLLKLIHGIGNASNPAYEELVNRTMIKLEAAEEARRSGDYYSAASLAFSATVDLLEYYVQHGGRLSVVWSLLNGTPTQLVGEARRLLAEKWAEMRAAAGGPGLWGFEALAAAYARLHAAEEALRSREPPQLVYAALRALTAVTWAEAAKPNLGPRVPWPVLRSGVELAVEYANVTLHFYAALAARATGHANLSSVLQPVEAAADALRSGRLAEAYGEAARAVSTTALGLAEALYTGRAAVECSRLAAYWHQYQLATREGAPSLVAALLTAYADHYAWALNPSGPIKAALYSEAAAYALLARAFSAAVEAPTRAAARIVVEKPQPWTAAVGAAAVEAAVVAAAAAAALLAAKRGRRVEDTRG